MSIGQAHKMRNKNMEIAIRGLSFILIKKGFKFSRMLRNLKKRGKWNWKCHIIRHQSETLLKSKRIICQALPVRNP